MTEELIDLNLCTKFSPDLIVSYNYRHILKKEIFSIPKFGTVNMHISYLPYNRGADPNLWSHIEGTPSGVTIHLIDEGIDTGPIITQKLVPLDKSLSLAKSWSILQDEIKALFMEYFELIKLGKYSTYHHAGGTFHLAKNKPFLEKGFETRIEELVK